MAQSIYDPQIQSTTVISEYQKPLLSRSTRWDYIKGYVPLWKEAAHFELYTMILAVIGIYFLVIQYIPVISVVCGFGAVYYHALREQRIQRMESSRKVIWNH